MRGHQLRRLATVVSTALLGVMLLGTGVASANPPGWGDSFVTTIPTDGVVAPNNNIGYVVTLSNHGKSNITNLQLKTNLPASAPNSGNPTYVGPVTFTGQAASGGCSLKNVPLLCNFGSLISGASVSVTVAYKAPATATANCHTPFASDFVFNTDCFYFQAFGNGSTTSDGGTSHGDALLRLGHVTLNSSSNFDGGFDINGAPAGDNTTLGRGNPQSTSVTPPATQDPIVVTVEDGTGTASYCTTGAARIFGECSRINVNNGNPSSPFRAVITIYGGSVPGGISASDIYVIHTNALTGVTTNIGQNGVRCTFTGTNPVPTNAECIVVTKVGNNFQIVIWLLSNGGLHNAY